MGLDAGDLGELSTQRPVFLLLTENLPQKSHSFLLNHLVPSHPLHVCRKRWFILTPVLRHSLLVPAFICEQNTESVPAV